MRKLLIASMTAAMLSVFAAYGRAQTPGSHPVFDSMDADQAGYVTKEQVQARFPKFTDEMFQEADTKGDGKLTLEEWQAFIKSRWTKRPAQSGS
jgi:Ca2+-binding EF-hand superfamily protein